MELIDSDKARLSWGPPIEIEGFIIGYRVNWTFDNEKHRHVDLPFPENATFTDIMSYKTISAIVCVRTQKGFSDISDRSEIIGPCSSEVKITTQASEEGESSILVLANF